MSRGEQRLGDYLQHILQAIERIQHYTGDIDEIGIGKNDGAGRRYPQLLDCRRG